MEEDAGVVETRPMMTFQLSANAPEFFPSPLPNTASSSSRSVHFLEPSPSSDGDNCCPPTTSHTRRGRGKNRGKDRSAARLKKAEAASSWRPTIVQAEPDARPHEGSDQWIIDQALEQLNLGKDKVYITGVANQRIASVLQTRPDIFRIQFYMAPTGRLAYNVHLAKEPHEMKVKTHVAVTVADDERIQLVHRVRMFQKASRVGYAVWCEYCQQSGFTSLDPEFLDSAELQQFFVRLQFKSASSGSAAVPIGGSIPARHPFLAPS